jgi:hypothetical protein
MPKWAKEKFVHNLRREINRKIDALIKEVGDAKGKNKTAIKPIARELLIESLNFIKYN